MDDPENPDLIPPEMLMKPDKEEGEVSPTQWGMEYSGGVLRSED